MSMINYKSLVVCAFMCSFAWGGSPAHGKDHHRKEGYGDGYGKDHHSNTAYSDYSKEGYNFLYGDDPFEANSAKRCAYRRTTFSSDKYQLSGVARLTFPLAPGSTDLPLIVSVPVEETSNIQIVQQSTEGKKFPTYFTLAFRQGRMSALSYSACVFSVDTEEAHCTAVDADDAGPLSTLTSFKFNRRCQVVSFNLALVGLYEAVQKPILTGAFLVSLA